MSSCLPFTRLFHRSKAPVLDDTATAGEIKTYTYTTHTPSGVALKVDVHPPAKPPAWPSPTVLFFHGGGLLYGDRESVLRGFCGASPVPPTPARALTARQTT